MRSGLLILAISLSVVATAQDLTLRAGLDSVCTGRLLDPGGARDYRPDERFVATLCPTTARSQLALAFRAVDIRAGDRLCIFDGRDTLAPQLSCASDWPAGGVDVQASLANPSGCLTLVWSADPIGQGRGFEAAIACRSACQAVVPTIASGPGALDSLGDYVIDLCAGALFDLRAGAAFPQNDRAYHQDAATTAFRWRRADGTEASGATLTEAFARGGAYVFELTAVDQRGCRSVPGLAIRARVAPRPSFTRARDLPDTLCAGEPLDLRIDATPGGQGSVQVSTPTQYFPLITQRVDSLPLPDGTGATHESAISIAHFAPGARLASARDLRRVCATVEHSWLRDLSIDLIAPDGRVLALHDHPGRFGSEAFLGVPIERDDRADPPPPGVGWEYCWTGDSPRGTWLGYLRDHPTTATLPEGDYAPRGDLASLTGAPLNGAWRLRVKDHWESDNGWIFSWRLEFDDRLPLRRDSFATAVTQLTWLRNPAQSAYAPTAVRYASPGAGVLVPTLRAVDDFGCVYDTSFAVVVLPDTHPDCDSCVSAVDTLARVRAVRGDTVRFDVAGFGDSLAIYRYAGTHPLTAASHPASRPLVLPLGVAAPPIIRLGAAAEELVEVCVDIDVADASDLTLVLQAPSGKTALLTAGRLAGRRGLRQTCFRTGGTALDAAGALVADVLAPQTPFETLAGERVDGAWSLAVTDDRGLRDTTWVYGFTLGLSGGGGARSLVLEPGVIELPSGVLATVADESRSYRFSRTDARGCTRAWVVPVDVREPCGLQLLELGYSQPTCPQSDDGQLTLAAIGQQGSVRYRLGERVSLDGKFADVASGPWVCDAVDSVGCTARLAGRLPGADTAGVDVYVEVRECLPLRYAVAIDTFGPIAVRDLRWTDDALAPVDYRDSLPPGSYRLRIADARGCITYRPVELPAYAPLAARAQVQAPSCAGGGDGSIRVEIEGGLGPYAVVWDDFDVGAERRYLYAGTYRGLVEDSLGCTAAFVAVVPETSGLELGIDVADAACEDGRGGSLSVRVAGGTPPYLYSIDGAPFLPDARFYDLPPGTYRVTVQDGGFCESTREVAVGGTSHKELTATDLDLPEQLTAGDTIELRIPDELADGEAVAWSYTESGWFACATCARTDFVPLESGTLVLVRGAGAECRTVDRLQLRVGERAAVLVPTGFAPGTPDGVLRVHGRSGTVIDRFAVFDRWGALLYEDRDFRVNAPRGWDGTLGGSPAPAGVYLYEVDVREASGAVRRIRGATTLLR